MHLFIFGILVTMGLVWQFQLAERLRSAPHLWSKHLAHWPQNLVFPFAAVVWGKLFDAQYFHLMALPALLCYAVPMLEAVTSIDREELKAHPGFSASIILPCILASLIAIGASLQAMFTWISAAEAEAVPFSTVNHAVLNALAFGLLFQLKALFSPIIVCTNVAWTGFIYLKSGEVEIWSAMENLLLLVLEPAAAASAAPWYVALIFVVAAVSTFGDALKAAADFD